MTYKINYPGKSNYLYLYELQDVAIPVCFKLLAYIIHKLCQSPGMWITTILFGGSQMTLLQNINILACPPFQGILLAVLSYNSRNFAPLLTGDFDKKIIIFPRVIIT
jgi:hypothetical protein